MREVNSQLKAASLKKQQKERTDRLARLLVIRCRAAASEVSGRRKKANHQSPDNFGFHTIACSRQSSHGSNSIARYSHKPVSKQN